MGLLHAVAVMTADVTDRDGAIKMILLNLNRISRIEKSLLDGGGILVNALPIRSWIFAAQRLKL